jgi:hypothetical protein
MGINTEHFYLLLRTGDVPVSRVMQRLLTGYVVNYNSRHCPVLAICFKTDISPEEIMERGRERRKVEARSILCYWATS